MDTGLTMTAGRRGMSALLAGVLLASMLVITPVAGRTASALGGEALLGEKTVTPTTTLEASAGPGDTLTYTINYGCSGTNDGDNCVGAVLSDTLPTFTDIYGDTSQLEFVSATLTSDWGSQSITGVAPNTVISWVAPVSSR
jgi:hypothetical protein